MVRVEGVGPERLADTRGWGGAERGWCEESERERDRVADTRGWGGQREGGVKRERERETVLLTLCSSNSSNPPVSLHTGLNRGSAEQERVCAHRGSRVQLQGSGTRACVHTGGAGLSRGSAERERGCLC